MMEQIDRDVLRTHPGLHFFSGDDGAAVTHREVCLVAGPHRPCVEQPGLASTKTSCPSWVEECAAANTCGEHRSAILQDVSCMAV